MARIRMELVQKGVSSEIIQQAFGEAEEKTPLLIFTSDGKLMGDLVNSKRVKQTGWVIMVLVVALNIWLLVGTALGL